MQVHDSRVAALVSSARLLLMVEAYAVMKIVTKRERKARTVERMLRGLMARRGCGNI